MSELIGKVQGEFKFILNQPKLIIEDLNINDYDVINFTPSHKLDKDELFQLINFSKCNFYIKECDKNFSSASLIKIVKNEYNDIDTIAIMQNEQIHFQKISKARFVIKKCYMNFSGEPKIIESTDQIEIKSESDAIYSLTKDILYFKNLGKIKYIFPNIEELHREATQGEVNNFLDNEFIKLSGFDNKIVGIQNRKRIADIGAKFEKLTNDKKQKLIKYVKDKSGLIVEKNKIEIQTDVDLKKLLYAMDQRYYYSDIYNENRVASSIRVI